MKKAKNTKKATSVKKYNGGKKGKKVDGLKNFTELVKKIREENPSISYRDAQKQASKELKKKYKFILKLI